MTFWVAGAAVAGGVIASSGAQSAASTQAAASSHAADVQAQSAKDALAFQDKQYQQQVALQEPYRQAGITAQNALMWKLGLSNPPPTTTQDSGGALGGILGNVTQNFQNTYGGDGGNTTSGMNPADYGSANKEFSMAGFDPNSLMKNFTAADYQADPGYAFRLSEGLKQLGHTAASRGGNVSGGTMKGIQDYAQNSASQEYQNAYNRYQANRAVQGQEYGNAFNRFQTNRTNQLQPLGNLMASGQNAASNQGAAAGAYGSSGANLMTGAGQAAAAGITSAGQANAAGQLGSANTISNALNTGASSYQNQTNFNNWLNKNTPAQSYSYIPSNVDTTIPMQAGGGY